MRGLKNNRSGQVLVLAALAIAFIISATLVYVYEASRVSGSERLSSPGDYVRIVKLGSMNLVIGTLANISHGGDDRILESNLERWGSFVQRQHYLGEFSLGFELCEDAPYSSGLRMSWGDDGFGVTSASADFSVNLTDSGTDVTVDYSVNVTTSVSVGAVSRWAANTHWINVTVNLCNEGEPALANNLTVYYETNDGGWEDAGLLDDYLLVDSGNGTYVASFTVGPPRMHDRGIRVECYDLREIHVEATTTCTDIE